MPKRELRSVAGVETIGAYTLLRLERGGIDPGIPGQFFMLEAPGRLLPRALSLCLAPPGELAFLLEAVGPGTEALCALQPERLTYRPLRGKKALSSMWILSTAHGEALAARQFLEIIKPGNRARKDQRLGGLP